MTNDYFRPFLKLVNPEEVPRESREACGLPSVPIRGEEGLVYCDGLWHMRWRDDVFEALERCVVVRRNEVRARIAAERLRLAGELGRLALRGALNEEGIPAFDGYDPDRHEGAGDALTAMRRFSERRPPMRSVLLVSPAGLGKTRLLLASHFALLAAGISSQYITTPELRRWIKRAENFDEEIAAEAKRHLDRFVYAQVIHFDDLGHIENDQRARGQFAEGLKDLLDHSRAKAWAVATNRSSAEMETHPDLSGTIVSRIAFNADIVKMSGVDGRSEPAQ